MLGDDALELVEGADVDPVHRHHAIARTELAVGGMSRQHHADGRRQERAVHHEDGEVEEQREDQVHHRSRQHHQDALEVAERFEGAVSILGQDDLGLGGLEQPHVAAERQEADAVLGLPPAQAQDSGPKPREKVMTFSPKALATMKWPSSWTKINELTRMTK